MTHNDEANARFLKAVGIRPEPLPSPEPVLAEMIMVPKDAWDRALAAYMAANDDGSYYTNVFVLNGVCEKLTRLNRSMLRALRFLVPYCAVLTVVLGVVVWRGWK